MLAAVGTSSLAAYDVGSQSAKAAGGQRSAAQQPSIPKASQELSADDKAKLDKLKQRDRQVRQHEAAHIAASGGLAAGAPTYQYQQGPDGNRYAVGGEVQISVSEGNSPEETLSRANRIRAAALAPADPSPQDRAVAALASQMATKARSEITQESVDQQQVKKQDTPENPPKLLTGEDINRLFVPDKPAQRGGHIDVHA